MVAGDGLTGGETMLAVDGGNRERKQVLEIVVFPAVVFSGVRFRLQFVSLALMALPRK